jgi:hypothetical protein
MIQSKEDIFELDHSCICEQEGGVTPRNQGRRWDKRVALLNEKIDEILANFCASELAIHGDS